VNWTLELIVVPVSDVDVAKHFYADRLGFTVDVDHRAGEDFRIVQLTPPGSACSITLMRNPDAAGNLSGLHLVVADADEAAQHLRERGVEFDGPFHFDAGGQQDGPHPDRADFGTFLSFRDPDGNHWMVQEVRSRAAAQAPGGE
jgi:catechol 2,3-dioxygenase-like lactoylglutathione lyase family enzyme